MCVKGKKLVLFITGLCAQRCEYCPVSEQKFGKDTVYANEWKIINPDNPKELFEEARLTEAAGAGITGGDPLVKIDRCCTYIRLLKKRFGKNFHIHLYTPLMLVNEERLSKLYEAGLDEIRFHPNLDDKTLWNRLELACKYDWDIGVEIPAVPGKEKQIKELIDYIHDKIDFLNLNELELSDTSASHYKLDKLGFKPKNQYSYAVKGSQEIAMKLLKYAAKKKLRTHYCTAKLKDGVQVAQRIKLRAKHAKLPYDITTKNGTLIRGCIYLKELSPGISYRQKIKEANKTEMLQKLKKLAEEIKIKSVIDTEKLRLIVSPKKIQEKAEQIKKTAIPAIVEEYPTIDGLEIEINFL